MPTNALMQDRPRPRGFRLNSADMINRDYGPVTSVPQPTREENINALMYGLGPMLAGPVLGPVAALAPRTALGSMAFFGGAGALNDAEAQSRGQARPVDPGIAAMAAKLPEHLQPEFMRLMQLNQHGGMRKVDRDNLANMQRIITESEMAARQQQGEQQNALFQAEQQRKNALFETEQRRQAADLTRAEEARMKVMREAPKTFAEQFPSGSAFAPIAPMAAAFATMLPFTLRNSLGKSRAASEWRAATKAGLEATDAPTLAASNRMAQAASQKFPEQGIGAALSPYAVPATIGAIEGAAIANIPDEWNASLPAGNPERAAYEAYLKELPARHPALERARRVYNELPQDNPAREASLRYFGNYGQVAAKTGIGALQGAGGGALAASVGKWFAPSEAGLPRAATAALQGRVDGTDVEKALRALEAESRAMGTVLPRPAPRQQLAAPPSQQPSASAAVVPQPPVAPRVFGYDPLAIQAQRLSNDPFDSELQAVQALINGRR